LLGHPQLTKRVLVIGSGVVGLCVALYCLRRGFTVTLVDRDSSGRRSCSFGNAGMIVPSHFVPLAAPGAVRLGLKWMFDRTAPFHIRPRLSLDLFAWLARFARSATRAHVERAAPLLRDLSMASRQCYEDLASAPHAQFGLVRNGLLILCRTAHALREEIETAEFARRLGLPAQPHVGRDVLALDPTLRADIAGAVHYPLDCHLSPDRLMTFLEAEVERAGGTFLWNTDVVGWRSASDGTRVLAARDQTGRDIEADEFVLCAGAWSPATVRDLGLAIPIQAGKGYSLTLPQFARAPAHCAILAEARVAVTPMDGGVRVGGTMELAGLTQAIDRRRARAVVESLSRYYEAMGPDDFAGIAPWSGLRPCSPDGLPYIGRTRRRANVIVATGHAMMGVTLAPITGKIVAMLVSGEPSPFDMALISPDRY
jgi:D-amino-acid dehydrogenase